MSRIPGTGALRKHQVPGHRGLSGDRGGFRVPHLPNHQDVWILAQQASKGGREGHSRLGVDRNLGNTLQEVFDRVLDGDDLLFGYSA